LRLVMVKLGLRAQNWPTDEEKVVLIEHIVSNFGGHRAEEIRLAFEMAIAGKLDLPYNDVKCYENFSCAYFSLIMSSYQRWASQAYQQTVKETPPPQRIFTQEENDNTARETAEWQYQMFLRGLELKNLAANEGILKKDKLIREDEEVIDFFERKMNEGFLNIYKQA
jgi:hypothetical protein